MSGTTNLSLQSVEINQVEGKTYNKATGVVEFGGGLINFEAYSRPADELAANQYSDITAKFEILGGSRQPVLKITQVISVQAPEVNMSGIEELKSQLRDTLSLNSKANKPQLLEAIDQAKAILS